MNYIALVFSEVPISDTFALIAFDTYFHPVLIGSDKEYYYSSLRVFFFEKYPSTLCASITRHFRVERKFLRMVLLIFYWP